MMTRLLIASCYLALLSTSIPSIAALCEDTGYTVSLGSIHRQTSTRQQKYNQFNPGIGVECGLFSGGVYYNSIRTISTYAGSQIGYTVNGWGLGVKYGLVFGYSVPVFPYLVGYVRIMEAVELTIIPPTEYNPLAIGYSLRF